MDSIIDKFRLTGRKAIVTGASRGIGRALAKGLAEAGADVAIADIGNEESAAKTIDAITNDLKRKAFFVKVDVTDWESVHNMVETVRDAWGRIDILINNAGICINTPAEKTDKATWLKVIDVNLNGVFYCSQAVSTVMIEQKSCVIINIGSMSGIVANYPQPQASYNTAKAGVHMLTKSLAMEWADYNIRVNAIAPGYINTELIVPFVEKYPDDYQNYWVKGAVQRRVGNPEELVGAAVYLASDASTYATGSIVLIDGGYTLR